MVTTACPKCRKAYNVNDESIGKMAKCNCGTAFAIQVSGDALEITDLPIPANSSATATASPNAKRICKACGSTIPSDVLACPFCNAEITKTTATGGSYVQALQQRLIEIDGEDTSSSKTTGRVLADAFAGKNTVYDRIAKKVSVIQTFQMPSDKEHLVEFFFYCDSNYQGSQSFALEYPLKLAWYGKAKMALEKLQYMGHGDPSIETLTSKFITRYRSAPRNPVYQGLLIAGLIFAVVAVCVIVLSFLSKAFPGI